MDSKTNPFSWLLHPPERGVLELQKLAHVLISSVVYCNCLKRGRRNCSTVFSPRSEPAKSPRYQRFKGPLGDSGKTGIQLRNWKDSWRYLDWARLRYVRHAYILLLSIYVPRVTIHLVPAPRMNKCNCAQLPSSSEHQV